MTQKNVDGSFGRDGEKVVVCVFFFFFFFKQKTAYEIGTGDWSSDVCSSDLTCHGCNFQTTYLTVVSLCKAVWPNRRAKKLVAIMGEGLVSFRHPVGFFALTNSTACLIGSIHKLISKLYGHALTGSLTSKLRNPP